MNENDNKNKMSTWPMIAAVAAGILTIELLPIHSELLRWLIAAIVTIVVFALSVMITTQKE